VDENLSEKTMTALRRVNRLIEALGYEHEFERLADSFDGMTRQRLIESLQQTQAMCASALKHEASFDSSPALMEANRGI